MAPTTNRPIDISKTVVQLEDALVRWARQENEAQAAATAAKQQLQSVALGTDEDALNLLSQIEDHGKSERVAASLRATASAQLEKARRELASQRATQQRREAIALWDRWRTHQARTDELVAQISAHEGEAYAVPKDGFGRLVPTAGSALHGAALDADAVISRAEVGALGESVCVRSGPVRDGVRTVWLSFMAPRLHLTAGDWRPVKMEATVDGAPLLSWASTRYECAAMYTREVPATAVVEIRGTLAYSIDDPATRA